MYGDHRDLHVLTHSFPTRRSSDLLLLVAALALALGAFDNPNRMHKSLYLYQIKEWSSFEPSAVDAAVKELLQAGESIDINGLHFDAAATQKIGRAHV